MACKLQNPKANSSDDWSCHRTPLLSKPDPAYLQPSAQNPKENDGTTYNVPKNLLNNYCRHTTHYNDKGLRIISKKSNGFDTFYEVDIAGSKFWAQRERLEASFFGRWLLADYEPRGLAYVFRSRNSETPKQAGLHLVYNSPGVFSVCGSACLHDNVVSKADLEATWRGRLFLTENRKTFVLSYMYYVWQSLTAPKNINTDRHHLHP